MFTLYNTFQVGYKHSAICSRSFSADTSDVWADALLSADARDDGQTLISSPTPRFSRLPLRTKTTWNGGMNMRRS